MALINIAGQIVQVSPKSILSAVMDFSYDNIDDLTSGLVNGTFFIPIHFFCKLNREINPCMYNEMHLNHSGPGFNSYPMVVFNSFLIHTRDMKECAKAKGLVDWMYWTQTSAVAAESASRSANALSVVEVTV